MSEELKNEVVEEAVTDEVIEEVVQETVEDTDDVGNIKISVDVVSTIAGIATSEIKGVAGMYRPFDIAEKLGAKKNPSKGVKVEMTDKAAVIDVFIVVDYGVRIPELAWEVQESVKNNVETMTGLDVERVNIHIEGVNFAAADAKTEVAAVPALEN